MLAVLFLIFNEGYLSSGDGDPIRTDLTAEAIRRKVCCAAMAKPKSQHQRRLPVNSKGAHG